MILIKKTDVIWRFLCILADAVLYIEFDLYLLLRNNCGILSYVIYGLFYLDRCLLSVKSVFSRF